LKKKIETLGKISKDSPVNIRRLIALIKVRRYIRFF